MKFRTLAVPALALGVGVVVGTAGSGQADPAVQTKTVTQTVTREATPQSCLDALDASEALTAQSRRYVKLTVQMPGMVVRAAKAGLNVDVAGIKAVTADMQEFTADTEAITAKVGPLVDTYNSAAAECRSH